MTTPSPRRSLASRLSLSVGLSAAVLSIAVLGLIAGLFIQRSYVHMEGHVQRSAAFLAESLEYPLWNLDLDAVKAIGQALAQDHVVGLVEVAGPRGETYYLHRTQHRILLERRTEVSHNGQVIGWVRVGLNDLELQATLWPVLLTGAGLAGLIILLQYLLHALFFRPLLAKPFASLDRLIAAYSAGDFTPDPPQVPYAEFAPLFRLLADMGSTIRRQMDDLKASEERLSLALDAANDGMWDWDVATGEAYFSPRYYTMLGYAPGEFAGSYAAWRNLLHPDDLERVDKALAPCLEGAAPAYAAEFQVRCKDGSWRWILARGKVVGRDSAGRARRFVGTHVDITERKGLALRLADQLAFQQALLDTIPYAVFYKGADTRFLGFNTAYEKTFGIRREDLLGKRVLDLEYLPSADRLAYQAEDETVIAGVGHVQKEMPIPFADGQVHQTLYSVSGFRQADGAPGGLIGVIVDITKRKQAEAALKASEERFAKAFDSSPAPLVISEIATGRFIAVNNRWIEMLGYGREEQIGRTSKELGIWAEPGQRDHAIGLLAKQGSLKDYPIEFLTKTGQTRSTLWSAEIVSLEGQDVLLSLIFDFTESKQAEAAMRRSEEKYRLLVEHQTDLVVKVDAEGRFLYVSPSYCRTFGKTEQELLGMTFMPLVHEEDLPATQEAMKALYHPPHTAVMEQRARTVHGWRWLAWSDTALPGPDGEIREIIGVGRDITERKQAEAALRQSEEKFSRIYQLCPDNIILSELDSGRIVDVNESFVRNTGHPRAEALGRTAAELGLYADIVQRDVLVRSLRSQGKVENLELEIRRRDGALRVGSISAQMLEIEGRSLMMSMLRDITETKKMQEMMVQTEKMISVGGIAAGIAHEINNPLGIVSQAAQNLARRLRPDLPKNQEAARSIGLDMDLLTRYMRERKLDLFIDDILSAAVRAAAIIRHMLDFSRRSESRRKVCDLPGIVRKALDLAYSDYDLKKSYDFKRIKVDLEIGDDLPVLNCTETEIEQVVLNLLRNAAQAMAAAEPPVTAPHIGIRLSARPGGARIVVEDNGPGMPPEVQRRIFEPFFTTKAPGVGTGLGLSVSYFIVTKGHGGQMQVESAPGHGARFTIDLPTEETRT